MIQIDDTRISSCRVEPDEHACACFDLEFYGGDKLVKKVTIAPRIIDIDGAFNTRDIGGYPTTNGRRVKWCRVYRSGSIAEIAEGAKNAIVAREIREVYDLRYEEEVEKSVPHQSLPWRVYSLPLHTRDERPGGFWRTVTRFDISGGWSRYNSEVLAIGCARKIGDVLKAIADAEDGAVLIQCTAGKDRTGIVVAALLLVLGVPEDIVLDDYTLSNQFFPEILNHAQDQFDAHPIATKLFNMRAVDLHPLFVARREVMAHALERIQEHYGGYEEYFRRGLGLEQVTIDTLRARYTE